MGKQYKGKEVILMLILLLALYGKKINDDDQTFQQFQEKYKKNYAAQKREKRKQVFEQNKNKLKEKRKENPNASLSKFADWTQQQKSALLTYHPESLNEIYQPYPSASPSAASQSTPLLLQAVQVPTSFDYRAQGKVSSVKDQNACGSCWAFSANAVFQSHIMLQGGSQVDISEQYTMDCTYPGENGCLGGGPGSALILLNLTGGPSQQQFPYTEISPDPTYANINMCGNTDGHIYLQNPAQTIDVKKYLNLTDSQIINQLITNGPLAVGVAGQPFWYVGLDGMLNNCPANPTINHAVTVVGYTPTHWIVKNSWGTYWGHGGYAYVNRSADCGLKQYVVVFKTGLNSSTYPSYLVKLGINMTDSRRNGWGWVLGLRQNGVIVSNFTLASGSVGTVFLSINAKYNTDIVVTKSSSSSSSEIGFKIFFALTNTILFTYNSGKSFTSTTILGTFCPSVCDSAVALQGSLLSSSGNIQTDSGYQNPVSSNADSQNISLTKLQVTLISVTSVMTTTVLFLIGFTCFWMLKVQKSKKRPRKNSQSFELKSEAGKCSPSGPSINSSITNQIIK